MNISSKKNIVNPEETAGFLSKLFFHWTLPLFRKASKSELSVDDLYNVLEEDKSETLGNELEKQWNEICENAKRNKKSPSFLSALTACHGRTFFLVSMGVIINQSLIRILPSVFVRYFIKSFSDDSGTLEEKIWYAFGIICATLVNTLGIHYLHFQTMHVGMKCSIASASLIYRKMLRLSRGGQNKTGVGQLTQLLANETSEFRRMIHFPILLFASPIQLILYTYILWQEFGISCLAGVGFVTLFTPLQYFLGAYSSRFRMKLAILRDQRAGLMNEIITAIRVIKMYAWEKPFSLLINSVRKLEIRALKQNMYLKAAYTVVFNVISKSVLLIAIIAYSMTGNPLTADKVFFAASVFATLNNSVMLVVPEAIGILSHIKVIIKRIETFLEIGELDQSSENFQVIDNADPIIVEFNQVHASWTFDKSTLTNISWKSNGSSLTMIVGSVGSGKSSFLNVILGELPVKFGKCTIQGKVSYASQDPWIFAGNVRQNILFGLPYIDSRYQDVISSCSLEEDMKQWPFGDLSIVGERGVTISGGQKARINLARALYAEADIYLLDDPLSAVDAKVSRHIFEKCILKYLRNKVTILVTHQLQYLPDANHIIVLNQGEIMAQGSYPKLLAEEINLVNLLGADKTEDKNRDSIIILEEGEITTSELIKAPVEPKEQMVGGSVTWKIYWNYLTSGNSSFYFPMIFCSFLILNIVVIGSDFWLAHWTSKEEEFIQNKNRTVLSEDLILINRDHFIWVYFGFIVAVCIGFVSVSIFFYTYFMQVGQNLHDRLFVNIVRAQVKFFDENSSGRIMNRFTKDLGSADDLLPQAIYEVIEILLKNASVVIILIATNYYMIFSTAFIFMLMYYTRRYYMNVALQLKRIESTTRSPVYAHLSATFEGLLTVRALKCQTILTHQFDEHQDLFTSASYILSGATRWFGAYIQMYCVLYLALVTFGFVFFSSSQMSGSVGLGVSSAMLLSSVQWALRQTAETENLMTSVERILEYSTLKPEAPLESKPELKPSNDWPTAGEIEFKSVTLSYGDREVLKNLSFHIKPQQKVGIVGRTGAGKSSIISALFRMTEANGKIIIDGVSVKEIGLHDLRSNISIIPQDPVLFSGTLRYNLDPFDQFEDSELWQALNDVELKSEITALDFIVDSKGSNFSVGQRQLVCLARAILRKNRIIVLDEATANVDHETDSLIQKTIREKFLDCTIITIAHRLDSVMDCDKIVVMDNGMLVEFDHPANLLEDPKGFLSVMVAQTGKNSSEKLRKMAHDKLY